MWVCQNYESQFRFKGVLITLINEVSVCRSENEKGGIEGTHRTRYIYTDQNIFNHRTETDANSLLQRYIYIFV